MLTVIAHIVVLFDAHTKNKTLHAGKLDIIELYTVAYLLCILCQKFKNLFRDRAFGHTNIANAHFEDSYDHRVLWRLVICVGNMYIHYPPYSLNFEH